MKREIFKRGFTEERSPGWPCPSCRGALRLVKGSLEYEQTRESALLSKHDAWEHEWTRFSFSARFKCEDSECGEFVMCVGGGGVDWFESDYQQFFYESFEPRYFFPALRLFEVHESAPPEVIEPLNRSFELYFASPSSALNHVRASVEALLTSLGIKRFAVAKGKKRKRLTLHDRIESLPPKFEAAQDRLLAVKWLGNAGSHGEQSVSADDVLDAYEILREVLDLVYSPLVSKGKQLARRINKKKGPLKQ